MVEVVSEASQNQSFVLVLASMFAIAVGVALFSELYKKISTVF
jgi:hypothetical protein